ncbi:MAG: hypothetical protein AB7F43_03535 [Bacteriovoracia bacterium]
MLVQINDLPEILNSNRSVKTGCIVDTNLLFAASFPLDSFNEWAEEVFKTLSNLQIPIFTNLNVRSEFIELNRRVLIPECLIDMHEDLAGRFTPRIEQQLKSLRTLKANASKENRTFKFSDSEIKRYRKLLAEFTLGSDNGWDLFCREYFHPFIKDVWNEAVEDLLIKFLGTREIEAGEFFTERPHWNEMVNILGLTGIGSSDAMIVNMFLKSKFTLIGTSDQDVSGAVSKFDNSRFVLAPKGAAA